MIERMKIATSYMALSLALVLISTPMFAQQNTENTSDQEPSAPLEKLTIEFQNGTADADGIGTITGVVFDIEKYRSSVGSGDQTSLIDELKKHGTRFQSRQASTTVSLDKPVPNPMLVVIYKGGIYQKKIEAGTSEQTISLTVYEPTRNRDVIRIQRHHIPLQRNGDRLRVSEIIRFTNTGDRTYVGPEGFNRSIPITLPENVHQVQGARQESGSASSRNSNTYWLSKTVSPDSTVSARISYHIPLDGSLTLERKVEYPTSNFFFVARNRGLQVTSTSSNLQKRARSAPSGKGDVVQIMGNNLSKGETVSVTLEPAGTAAGGNMQAEANGSGSAAQTETSNGGGSSSSKNYILIIIGVVAGLSLVVSFSVIVLMYGSGNGDSVSSNDETLSRDVLLEEIAQLDQDLENGKITEEYHEQRRSRLKSRLMALDAEDGPDARPS